MNGRLQNQLASNSPKLNEVADDYQPAVGHRLARVGWALAYARHSTCSPTPQRATHRFDRVLVLVR